MNPVISSGESSSPRIVTLFSFEKLEDECSFVSIMVFDTGMNEWSLRVPGIVRACLNRSGVSGVAQQT